MNPRREVTAQRQPPIEVKTEETTNVGIPMASGRRCAPMATLSLPSSRLLFSLFPLCKSSWNLSHRSPIPAQPCSLRQGTTLCAGLLSILFLFPPLLSIHFSPASFLLRPCFSTLGLRIYARLMRASIYHGTLLQRQHLHVAVPANTCRVERLFYWWASRRAAAVAAGVAYNEADAGAGHDCG